MKPLLLFCLTPTIARHTCFGILNFDATPPPALSSRDFRQVELAFFGASFTMHHDLFCHKEFVELFSEEVNVAGSVMSMLEEHNALLMLARLRGRHSSCEATCFNSVGKRSHTAQLSWFRSCLYLIACLFLFVPNLLNCSCFEIRLPYAHVFLQNFLRNCWNWSLALCMGRWDEDPETMRGLSYREVHCKYRRINRISLRMSSLLRNQNKKVSHYRKTSQEKWKRPFLAIPCNCKRLGSEILYPYCCMFFHKWNPSWPCL